MSRESLSCFSVFVLTASVLSIALSGCGGLARMSEKTGKKTLESPVAGELVFIEKEDGSIQGPSQLYSLASRLYPSGAIYSGFWRQDEKNGLGLLFSPENQNLYMGEFADDHRTGFGVLVSRDSEYRGYWRQDVPDGYGALKSVDDKGQHSFYAGYWSNGLRSGNGLNVGDQKTWQEGTWNRDLLDGFGERVDADGNWYQGSWFQGQRDGYGRSLHRSGNAYEGTWRRDQRAGYGVETYIDGSRYAGEWSNDLKTGYGEAVLNNGIEHAGYWLDNKPWGKGTRTFPTGFSLSGVWAGDLILNGRVRIEDRPQAEYEGPIQMDGNAGMQPHAKLLSWLKALAEEGSSGAQNLLIMLLNQNGANDDSLPWLEKAADTSPEAAFILARSYLRDESTASTFWPKAFSLLKRAADQNYLHACLELGNLYYRSDFLTRDDSLAASYFDRAFKGGSLVARNNLAWLLATSHNDQVRQGERALLVVRPVVENYPSAQHFDTLAAVYAELEYFGLAVGFQQEALRLMVKENRQIPQVMQDRLERYQQKMPWRE